MEQRSSTKVILLILCLLATIAKSFQLGTLRPSHPRHSISRLNVVYDPRTMDVKYTGMDFPTPAQRKVLKKEAARRHVQKELPIFTVPLEETEGSFSAETLKSIHSALAQNELVEVRGISRNDKKLVFTIVQRLVEELETMQDDYPVAMLGYSGFSTTLYSPTLPVDHPLHVTLRTSIAQRSVWIRRPKAPRDHRGRIIKHTDDPSSDINFEYTYE